MSKVRVTAGGKSDYARQQDLSQPVPGLRMAMGRRGGPARLWDASGSIDVELLAQWALVDQRAGASPLAGLNTLEAMAAGYTVRNVSSDGIARIEAIGRVGCTIDVSAGVVPDDVHDAALAVAVALHRIENGDLVRHYARLLGPPMEWVPPTRWLRPRWEPGREGERPMVLKDDQRTKHGEYCPLVSVWGEREAAWGRAIYSAWWNALVDLKFAVSTRNLGFLVTGPAAPEAPWEAIGA